VCPRPGEAAIRWAHESDPNGRPRITLRRSGTANPCTRPLPRFITRQHRAGSARNPLRNADCGLRIADSQDLRVTTRHGTIAAQPARRSPACPRHPTNLPPPRRTRNRKADRRVACPHCPRGRGSQRLRGNKRDGECLLKPRCKRQWRRAGLRRSRASRIWETPVHAGRTRDWRPRAPRDRAAITVPLRSTARLLILG